MRIRVAIVGLSAVGKSSLVATLHGRAVTASIAPTQGCNKSTISRNGHSIDLLDIGGQAQVRRFWSNLAEEASALIVMSNSAEIDGVSWTLLASELRALRCGRPVLLLLNRHDMPEDSCVSAADALTKLGLEEPSDDYENYHNNSVHVVSLASSSDAVGADAGLAWLCDVLAQDDDAFAAGASSDAAEAMYGAGDVTAGATFGGGDGEDEPSRGGARHAASEASDEYGDGGPSGHDDHEDEGDDDEEEEPLPMGHAGDGGAVDDGGDGGGGAGGRSTRLRLVRELRAARSYAGAEAEQEVELIQQRLMSGHILSEGELELLRASGRGAGAAEM